MESPPTFDGPPPAVEPPAVVEVIEDATARPTGSDRRPFARLRRRLHRLRPERDDAQPADGHHDLTLELMLLREESVRLKSDRHRPLDVGTVIDQLRVRAEERERGQTVDEAFTMLSQYLLLRENLTQASVEVDVAIAATRARLADVLDDDKVRPITSASASVAEAA
jgi:hypothetical protein